MTKKEFKERWEKNEAGGGITFDDIAQCAKDWGVSSRPKTMQIEFVRYMVLKAANTSDCEEYKPDSE